jgi:RNA polymerase sigma-70 factor (ECF subfamily)
VDRDSEQAQRTSENLLLRLRSEPVDEAAWAEFVARYADLIHRWCGRWGLQEADAADVTQAVLLRLVAAMRTFVYDSTRSFRGWLKTLTHHAWHDLIKSRRQAVADSHEVEQRLRDLEARDDRIACVQLEGERKALLFAIRRVRRRVQPHTWEAFRLTAVNGLSGDQAAARVGVPVASVYKARSNVKKLLQKEVRYLERAALP